MITEIQMSRLMLLRPTQTYVTAGSISENKIWHVSHNIILLFLLIFMEVFDKNHETELNISGSEKTIYDYSIPYCGLLGTLFENIYKK